MHEAIPRSGCTACKEEGEGKDAFFSDFLLDWIGGENVSPRVETELKATRTSRRGKSHNNDVAKNTERYDPRHDPRSNVVAKNFAKEYSGHVEVIVQSLIYRYSAQLSYGQPCPKYVAVALSHMLY